MATKAKKSKPAPPVPVVEAYQYPLKPPPPEPDLWWIRAPDGETPVTGDVRQVGLLCRVRAVETTLDGDTHVGLELLNKGDQEAWHRQHPHAPRMILA